MLVLKGTLYSQFTRQPESKCYRESDLPNQKISTSLIWKADLPKENTTCYWFGQFTKRKCLT